MISLQRRIFIFVSCCFLSGAVVNAESSIQPLSFKVSKAEFAKTEKRKILMTAFQSEIAESSQLESDKSSTGDWYGVIESALFMLVRRTEIYRGKMRLIITSNNRNLCRIYPDGTTIISESLLDYIDTNLFMSSQNNMRKIKNFNAERENYLAPIIAFEAARFALDLDVNHLLQQGAKKLPESAVFAADEFSAALLKAAGYKASQADNFLQELKTIQTDKKNAGTFSFFFDNFPSPDKRISRMATAKYNAEKLGEEISNVLSEIRMQKGISDAMQTVLSLKENYKDSIYFARLEAVTAHCLWMESTLNEKIPSDIKEYSPFDFVLPAVPAAVNNSYYAKKYFSALDIPLGNLSIYIKAGTSITGSRELFLQALKAYEEYAKIIFEGTSQAAYAALLARSPNVHDKTAALKIAEEAVLNEQGAQSEAAEINYAVVLFLTMRDFTKAKSVLKEITSGKVQNKNTGLFLTAGKYFDQRIPLFNYALILKALGETKLALAAKDSLKEITQATSQTSSAFYLRKLKAGDTADELIENWGRPSFIVYNYFFERWIYGYLDAEIIISDSSKTSRVEYINILNNSTITLPKDIRVGDSKKAFEKVFGKPVYFAGDCDIYFYGGAVLQVLYSSGTIKTISISQYF